jgi:hypothetical protein
VTHPQVRPDPAFGLLELYDDALPHVYGYLPARCGDTGLAEDLTAESFLAAVHAVRKPGAPDPSFSPGHPGTWRTGQTRPPLGIMPSQGAEPGVQLSYRVDDIAAAVERVRAAGGHAGEPALGPFGLFAECADDQGATFHLWQPANRPER